MKIMLFSIFGCFIYGSSLEKGQNIGEKIDIFIPTSILGDYNNGENKSITIKIDLKFDKINKSEENIYTTLSDKTYVKMNKNIEVRPNLPPPRESSASFSGSTTQDSGFEHELQRRISESYLLGIQNKNDNESRSNSNGNQEKDKSNTGTFKKLTKKLVFKGKNDKS